jgi:curved DNA-binding protein CbpA
MESGDLNVTSPDPHVVLGVAPDATWDEIVHAYRRLVRLHHPDLSVPDAPRPDASGVVLGRVLEAYATLRDADRRAGPDAPRRPPPTATELIRRRRAGGRRDQPPLRAGPVIWAPAARRR